MWDQPLLPKLQELILGFLGLGGGGSALSGGACPKPTLSGFGA